jgi:hypothetical protein
MNRGLYIARKNYLITLIRKYARLCNENDFSFLEAHINDTIEVNPGESIERVIDCYNILIKEKEKYG